MRPDYYDTLFQILAKQQKQNVHSGSCRYASVWNLDTASNYLWTPWCPDIDSLNQFNSLCQVNLWRHMAFRQGMRLLSTRTPCPANLYAKFLSLYVHKAIITLNPLICVWHNSLKYVKARTKFLIPRTCGHEVLKLNFQFDILCWCLIFTFVFL
jgi:hypothetical protein